MSDEDTWVGSTEHPGVMVQVAMVGGRVTIVGVRVLRPDGVTLDDLRAVPLQEFEARFNDPNDEGGHFVASFARDIEGEMRAAGYVVPEAPKGPTKRQLTLAIPAGHRYPDTFYVKVATLYQALVANGRRPAPALAEANGVAETTVHRWIRETRRRGIMPPGRKGRAG